MSSAPIQKTFAYTAQTFNGKAMTGTIDAADLEDASSRLADLRMRVMSVQVVPTPRAKPLGREDFAAFNQQLAYLSAAHLPIEQGLRLIAEDFPSERIAQSIRDVSAELDQGVSLGDAFNRHEKQFPPLYGTLIEAGVRSGNLSAALLNLGRHLELVARLRAAIWRAVAYPLTVFAGLLIVLIFLGHFVLPTFQLLYANWYWRIPLVTRALLELTNWTPLIIAIAIAFFIGMPLTWMILRAMNLDRAAADSAIPLPLIGPILRSNLIARWCDAMKIAVQSGMDLPAAVQLSSDIVSSPALKRDGEKIIHELSAGNPLDHSPQRLRVLPLAVLSVVHLATQRNDLPESLQTLGEMYQQQAEMRVGTLQGLLTPTLIIMVGIVVGFVVVGLFAPMVSLLGPFH
jgi:type IV pilus assembly protein PilC